MAMVKHGIDYRLVEYNNWIVGINDRDYVDTVTHMSGYALWTKRFVIRLI